MYAVYDAVSRSDCLQWVMTAKVCVCVCLCLSSPSNVLQSLGYRISISRLFEGHGHANKSHDIII